jgi:predicted metal-dependent RNase
MRLPQPERLGLVQRADKAQEWWVTLDGRRVVGFSGHAAQQRAAKYFRELTTIAEGVHSWRSADRAFTRRGV